MKTENPYEDFEYSPLKLKKCSRTYPQNKQTIVPSQPISISSREITDQIKKSRQNTLIIEAIDMDRVFKNIHKSVEFE